MQTIFLPPQAIDKISVGGIMEPEAGKKLDFDGRVYTDKVTLDEIRWEKMENGAWVNQEKGTVAEEKGDYKLSAYMTLDDGWYYQNNSVGKTQCLLNYQESRVYDVPDEAGKVVLYRIYHVGPSKDSDASWMDAYEKWQEGNLFKVTQRASLLEEVEPADGRYHALYRLKAGDIVSMVSLTDTYCLVDFKEYRGYIHRSFLSFFGYSEESQPPSQISNYEATADVNVAKDAPMGPIIGVVPKGATVTFVELLGTVAKIRFGPYYGYVPTKYFTPVGNPATDLFELVNCSGFYRVTANSVNIRSAASTDSSRVGGLKKGDVICVTGTRKGDSPFAIFTYQGKNAYVTLDALEKVPLDEWDATLPYITQGLSDVTVKEGGTAVFSFDGINPAYCEQTVGIDDKGNPILTGTSYFFLMDYTKEYIEEHKWGKVDMDYRSSTLTIRECSRELDGMGVIGAIIGYNTAITEEAHLTVIPDDSKKQDTIDEVTISSHSAGVTIFNSKETFYVAPTEDGKYIEPALQKTDEFSHVTLALISTSGHEFSEDVLDNIETDIPGYELESAEFSPYRLTVSLAPKVEDKHEATNAALLSVAPAYLEFREGDEVDWLAEIQNETHADQLSFITEGTLPAGLTFEDGHLSGTLPEGTGGLYLVNMKASTGESYETVTKTEKQEVHYQKYVGDEVRHNQHFTVTIPRSVFLNTVPGLANEKYIEYTEGMYHYTISCFPNGTGYYIAFASWYNSREDGEVDSYLLKSDGTIVLQMTGDVAVPIYEDATRMEDVEVEEKVKALGPQEADADLMIRVIPSHMHRYEETVKEGSCTEGMHYTYTCAECGDTYSFDTDPLGHVWGEWIPEPGADCEKGFDSTSTCEVCGATQTRHTDGMSHVDKDSDCHCDLCGKDFSDEVISHLTGIPVEELKKGHDKPTGSIFNGKDVDPNDPANQEANWGKKKGFPGWWILILLLLLLILIAIALIIIFRRIRKEKKQIENGTEKESENDSGAETPKE